MNSVIENARLQGLASATTEERLREEITAHAATRRELAAARRGLEDKTAERARELNVLRENEAHLRLLMRELTHRSKNLLAVIQAMARQTARHVGTVDSFLERFSARLQALSRSHDLLVQESWHGVALGDLMRAHLEAHLDRVRIEGPDAVLKPEAAQSFGLALHELTVNAAKYGALSGPSGRVEISWQKRPDGAIEIVWKESGGPCVDRPTTRGFGRLVIEHNLARAIEAEVDLSFDPEGLQGHVIIPASQLSSEGEQGTLAPAGR